MKKLLVCVNFYVLINLNIGRIKKVRNCLHINNYTISACLKFFFTKISLFLLFSLQVPQSWCFNYRNLN